MAKPANPGTTKVTPVTRTGKPVPPTPEPEPKKPQVPAVKPEGRIALPPNWRERLAPMTAETKRAETPQNGFISFRNSRMSFNGVQLPGDKIRAIVVNYWKDNEYYDKKYVAGESNTPVCHAIVRPNEILTPWRMPREGENTEDLELDEDSGLVTECSDVQVEPGQTCESCEKSQWGSMGERADGRKSKAPACRMSRRLQILAADQCTTPADVERAAVMTMIPPPTSIDNFQIFANQVSGVLDVPIFGVVVDISLQLHDKYMFMIHYVIVEKINDDEILYTLMKRHEALAARPVIMPKMDDSKEVRDQRGSKF